MRPDLQTRRQWRQGRRYWVVKDPLSLRYYCFEDEEFALLEMLDGRASLEQIQDEFERRFTPQRISPTELHRYLAMLHRSGLVISDAPGQGQELMRRGDAKRRQRRVAALSQILAARFKGIDPDGLLTRLNACIGGFFSLPAVVMTLLVALSALALVFTHFDEFQAKLPTFQQFFAAQNWLLLAMTLAATKVLHEFGHGLACKRFGGECHEMGLMLLVFTPCLYCNVTDSWMLPSKWRRAAVAAAGMYVELVLATAATFLWWFTHPGVVNSLCLNVMFICSVSTLAFNANPLLRYDGYYILSDLLEIPNLRQKASAVISQAWTTGVLGLRTAPDPFMPQRRRGLFALYAVAAGAYRWVVTFSILWFLWHVLEPYGLQAVGQALTLTAVVGMIIPPVVRAVGFVKAPGRWEAVKKLRLTAAIAVGGALLAAALGVPLPHYVTCRLTVQPRDAAHVYVDAPGRLAAIHAAPGDYVSAGEPLATLENVELRLRLEQLAGRRAELLTRLDGLRRAAFRDEQAAQEIVEVEKALLALEDQLARRERDLARLTISASAAGTILAPPTVAPPHREEEQLSAWSGSPLERENLGAFLTDGVLLCQIGDPRKLEVVLAIDQEQIEFLRSGQQVDVVLQPLRTEKFTTRIEHISQAEMQQAPTSLSSQGGGTLPTAPDAAGQLKPLTVTYQASATLEDPAGAIVPGSTGHARVHAGRRTLGQRAWRAFCATFKS
jgi:putative peptide zinc metalloprotease protein